MTRAARHVPFRAVCLQQAFAALLMLRRRHLPHAWSYCGQVGVTGVAAAEGFVAVAAFTA